MEGLTTKLLAGEGWQATLEALAVDGPATHSVVLKYTTAAPCRFDEDPVQTTTRAFAWSRQPNGPSHSQGLRAWGWRRHKYMEIFHGLSHH